MMSGFGTMIEKLKKNPKSIVFTEGTDSLLDFWQVAFFILSL